MNLIVMAINSLHFCSYRIKYAIAIAMLLLCHTAISQPSTPGKLFRTSSPYNMFPDSLRQVQPRVYGGRNYDAATYYSDSSVLLYVPDYFNEKKPWELIVWLHGWNNNIDSSVNTFHLLEQAHSSRRNAIFIFPEGPKNAPDSYAGKFETGLFNIFIPDMEKYLLQKNIIHKKNNPSGIVLSGHSGAYRGIAKILENAMYPLSVDEVILLDALYGENDSYLHFVRQYPHRLTAIYTDEGGTKENTLHFMRQLDTALIPYRQVEEKALTRNDLEAHCIIFIHSTKGHNEVVYPGKGLEKYLVGIKDWMRCQHPL